MAKYLFLLLLLIISGCDTPKGQIKQEIDNFLGFDISSEFEIVKTSSMVSIGDMSNIYTIKFKEKKFNELLSKIDLQTWSKMNNNVYVLKKQINENEYKSITIFINTFELQYTYIDQ